MRDWGAMMFWADYIAVGILLTAISMNVLRRLESCIRAYTINSFLLAALVAYVAFATGESHLYLGAGLTFVGKAVVLPLFLRSIVRRMKATHEVDPYLSNALSLTISGILVAVVYGSLRKGMDLSEGGVPPHVLQIAIAVILIGLLIMITRKKAVTQVVGLLFMENGLFLAGFSLTLGMPLMVELGVLLDTLMGVIILGIFAVQIKRAFRSSDLDRLTVLRG